MGCKAKCFASGIQIPGWFAWASPSHVSLPSSLYSPVCAQLSFSAPGCGVVWVGLRGWCCLQWHRVSPAIGNVVCIKLKHVMKLHVCWAAQNVEEESQHTTPGGVGWSASVLVGMSAVYQLAGFYSPCACCVGSFACFLWCMCVCKLHAVCGRMCVAVTTELWFCTETSKQAFSYHSDNTVLWAALLRSVTTGHPNLFFRLPLLSPLCVCVRVCVEQLQDEERRRKQQLEEIRKREVEERAKQEEERSWREEERARREADEKVRWAVFLRRAGGPLTWSVWILGWWSYI